MGQNAVFGFLFPRFSCTIGAWMNTSERGIMLCRFRKSAASRAMSSWATAYTGSCWTRRRSRPRRSAASLYTSRAGRATCSAARSRSALPKTARCTSYFRSRAAAPNGSLRAKRATRSTCSARSATGLTWRRSAQSRSFSAAASACRLCCKPQSAPRPRAQPRARSSASAIRARSFWRMRSARSARPLSRPTTAPMPATAL